MRGADREGTSRQPGTGKTGGRWAIYPLPAPPLAGPPPAGKIPWSAGVPVWVQPGLCWALDTGAGGGGVACMDPAVYHPASSRISRIQCIVHPNPLFRHLKAACHHHFPSPRPPHSAPDRQTSVRDLAISAGGEGGSLLPLTKHLTCAKAAQLLSFNPPGPCEAAP